MTAGSGQGDTPLRVALLGCTSLLGDLIRVTLSGRQGIEIVFDSDGATSDAALAHHPDVVVWQLPPGTSLRERADPFGVGRPPAIVTVQDDGGHGSVWRLRRHRTPLGELSPELLVEAVTRAGREGEG